MPSLSFPTSEHQRLQESEDRVANWKRWGPYLPERQWGTVREDYSPYGEVWGYFTHDHARSRAYRWGEDGLLGICDRECRLCFSLALWNGNDPILKERLFGLTGPQGNHGEDVKECYYYLDSTPTHSYMKCLYKYPQAKYPYSEIVGQNRDRSKHQREWELADSGIFDDNKYFDVFSEYAKGGPDDLFIRITIANRGKEMAPLTVIPTLWFRNMWSWGCDYEFCGIRPGLKRQDDHVVAWHETLGEFQLFAEPLVTKSGRMQKPKMLFCENETNPALFGIDDPDHYSKDAFHEYVIHNKTRAVNPKEFGTKAGLLYQLEVPGESEITLRLRLSASGVTTSLETPQQAFAEFNEVFQQRQADADEFYAHVTPATLSKEERRVYRQASAGLLWTKQFYHYAVQEWIEGDPAQPTPMPSRKGGRNKDWEHLFNRDVISMPDKWEYPWYAAWDLAFHMLPFAQLDPDFARKQLVLFLREWYMHPNGQMPAYEFAFSDVNPPVHAWACWRVYQLSGEPGKRDKVFLARTFQKLLLNFTWWVNRKDVGGKHLFSGGFLGLDNIGVFDRSKELPMGGHLEQADGTAWMAFYCCTMLTIALELAEDNPAYEDMASKFFEHFIAIADAMNHLGDSGLWDEADGFYYDRLNNDYHGSCPLKIRSLVGLIPLIAVEVLEEDVIAKLPDFRRRMQWFLDNRPEMGKSISYLETDHEDDAPHGHRLLAIPSKERLEKVLQYMLDENEFLSPFGIRSMSKFHQRHPFKINVGGQENRVSYTPAESTSGLFGGNSNWRGPIWFPINFLIIEALQRYHFFYGDDFQIEFPTGSGVKMNLQQVSEELSARLVKLFLPDDNGRRPCHGEEARYQNDPHWKDLVLFYEYFHGDNGRGAGASHQTGWTALVADLLTKLHK